MRVKIVGIFYWHHKNEKGKTLSEELLSCDKVSKIKIATAYLSMEGIKVISELKEKYNLNINNIEVYISPEFSMDQPHILLKRLVELCKVYMVFNNKFHAKVYFIKGQDKYKLIFGSSNLTYGGLSKNIEFDFINEIDKQEEAKLNMFFDYCRNSSKEVENEIILFYEKQNQMLKSLVENKKKLEREIYKFQNNNDAFDKDTYDLNNRYFNFDDYETLFLRNQSLDDIGINNRRKTIQNKILAVNEYIYNDVKKLGVYHHWRNSNITSLIRPCVYNNGKVGWVGARYGKHEEEIKVLNVGADKDEELGFQKHACLQYCITQYGLEINLFHAVKRDAVDRGYLHEKITSLAPKIVDEIDNLKGKSYVWYIDNDKYSFHIDKRDSKEFIEFYQKYDLEGRNSYLAYFISPDDKILESKETLGDFILQEFQKLIPLYNLLSMRLK
ncbi:NgoFVII family restriction endonuclease [Clostridium butyricum]|nr:phospholipase D family protein [Clostridium butyricum]RSC94245.1 NgoFVII family restriction endonuclease [Clostridium butyricum]